MQRGEQKQLLPQLLGHRGTLVDRLKVLRWRNGLPLVTLIEMLTKGWESALPTSLQPTVVLLETNSSPQPPLAAEILRGSGRIRNQATQFPIVSLTYRRIILVMTSWNKPFLWLDALLNPAQRAGRPVPGTGCQFETWVTISPQALGSLRRPGTDNVVYQVARGWLVRQSEIGAPLTVSLTRLLPRLFPDPSLDVKNSALLKQTVIRQTLGRWYACP